MNDTLAQEVESFLEKNPAIKECDLLLPDMNGVLRGKRIQRDKLLSLYKKGLYFPASVFGLDVTGETMEETGLGFESGDQDKPCYPIENSLTCVPWQNNRAQLLLQMFETDGSAFYGNPREVLRKLQANLRNAGMHAVVAVEIEFYLIDPKRKSGETPIPVRSPQSGQRETEGQLYSLNSIDAYDEFFRDITAAAESQNIPANTAHAELAPGQFEINLHHVSDVVSACDHAILLKRIIRSVAQKHSMEVTFMAKPYSDQPGSGMHVHISIIDDEGKNLFQGEDEKGNAELGYAVEGIRTILNESVLICAPHANSYHRMQFGSYAPVNKAWGYNNRTVSLRIPANDGPDMRIEHRLAGADANPYLLVSSILSGILHGLEIKKTPPAPVQGNAYLNSEMELANNWQKASLVFDRSSVLPRYLGNEFCHLYSQLKHGEQSRFLQKIAPQEYDWYLKTV